VLIVSRLQRRQWNGWSSEVKIVVVSAGYPVVIDVRERLAVIVGGGAVGLRKAQGLLASGAKRVRVVSPTFHPEMPAVVERVAEAYRSEHLHGASLVFAATDSPQVNDCVVSDARAIGALVCRADVDEENAGDFVTPALLRKGPLLVTVSSGGSPALSAMIRDRLDRAIDARWVKMAEAMQVLRPLVRQSIAAGRRRDVFQMLCSDEAMRELERGGVDELLRWLKTKFAEL
jgi:siroheme synthase-like protein